MRFPFMRYILLMQGMLLAAGAFAQTYTVKGKIGSKEEPSMPYASVVLLQAKDSVMGGFAITKGDGSFEIKRIKPGNYLLQVSFVGYKTLSKPVEVKGDLDLGMVTMEKSSVDIDQYEVVDERVPIQIKGDTVAYNAKAFKTQANADVEELLKKLPGVEVDKDGKIKAQGEEVKKVLVDGKEFFGDDPKMATKNLPADAIDEVQVFDKESDMSQFTGVSDGNDEKTINLKLKPGKKKGYFGNITGGYGNSVGKPTDRFKLKGSVNRFSKKTQLSFIGMGNNLNEAGFSWDDYVGMMGGMQAMMMGGGFSFGDVAMPFNWGQNKGITQTWAGGFNLNSDLSKNTQLYASYFYNRISNTTNITSHKEYFNAPGNYSTEEGSNSTSLNNSHRLNTRLKHKIDSTQDITWRTELRYNDSETGMKLTQNSYSSEGALTNGIASDVDGTGTQLDASSDLQYRKKFAKPGRSFVVDLSGSYGDGGRNGNLQSNNQILQFDTIAYWKYDTIIQEQDYNKGNKGYTGDVRYVEPLGKKKYMEFTYKRGATFTDLVTDYFDVNPELSTRTYNSRLSTNYANQYIYDRGGASFRIANKKVNVSAGAEVQYSELDGKLRITDTKINQTFLNVLPNFRLRYNISKGKTMRLRYRTSVNEPSIEQLSPVVNNSNPLRIYVGNPNLKAEYRHTARFRYNAFNQFAFTSFFVSSSMTYTKNKVQNQVLIDSNLVQTTTPVNVANDLNLNTYVGFGAPVRPLKIKFDIFGYGSYRSSILLQNGVPVRTHIYNNSGTFAVENRKKDNFDLRAGTEITYNITTYEGDAGKTQEYITNRYFGDLVVYFLKKWTFSGGADYNVYTGEAFASNQSIPILRASLSRVFLKGDRGQLEFMIYDILNKNIGFQRNQNLNYIEQQTSNTLGRYFMLNFTYSLKGFKARQNDSRRGMWRWRH